MGRSIRSAKLDTPTARRSLKVDKNPYWERLGQNEFFGYRKGKRTGSWVARVRLPNNKFKFQKIGAADDHREADGAEVLTFYQAQAKAKEWCQQVWRMQKGYGLDFYTVDQVLDEYLDYLKTHKKSAKRAEYSIKTFISPQFGPQKASDLTSHAIRDWLKSLAQEKPRIRSVGGQTAYKEVEINCPEYQRKRKASANRIFTHLKAALNRAYQDGKIASDEAWRRVKPFQNVEKAVIRFIEEEECRRLVNASNSNFRPLVQAALFTGCRYGEIIKMKKRDFHPEHGVMHIPETKTGKPRYVTLDKAGTAFFEAMVVNLDADSFIFTKGDEKKPWKRSEQARPMKAACDNAGITPAISFNILRHTHASQLIRNGAPIPVIAQQLGNSPKICEKHYAHLAPSYVSDTIRANFPKLDIYQQDKNIHRLNV